MMESNDNSDGSLSEVMSKVKRMHELVWDDEPDKLKKVLETIKDLSIKDKKGETIPAIDGCFRGTTALGLASQLGRHQCIDVLLKYWADTLQSSEIGYYPLQEATSLGNRDIMKQLLLRRHEQMRQIWQVRQPGLASALHKELPDFFLEMDWNFQSWVPFLARFCPSDRCKIWKKGDRLRVDSTIMGVEMQKMTWRTGNVSFVFHVYDSGSKMFALDHDQRLYEEIDKTRDFTNEEIEDELNMRLNTQIYATKVRKPVDEDGKKKVQFIRQQAGFFGMSGDKEEQIGIYQTRVYDVPGIEFITKHRNEHILARESTSSSSSSSAKGSKTSVTNNKTNKSSPSDAERILDEIQGLDSNAEDIIQSDYKHWFQPTLSLSPPKQLPAVDRDKYFGDECSFQPGKYIHAGRPLTESSKSKKFRVSVWMADNFPLTVHQLMPFFELMTMGNKNFEKLQEFISMDLPPGFPVRIEIPIFAFLSAQITFLDLVMWKNGIPSSSSSSSTSSSTSSSGSSKRKDSKSNPSNDIPKPEFAGIGQDWFEIPSTYKKGIVLKSIFKEDS